MEHVAKWSVVAVVVLAMITAVTNGMKTHDGTDESTGRVLIAVLLGIWVTLAVTIWWQP